MGKQSNGAAPGEVRIIGGQWRSRRIPVPAALGLRPTADRMRETLFNWLQFEIPKARCLDLFAGSGALGFEAASREAAQVVMIERNPQVAQHLRTQAQRLAAHHIEVIQTDALHYLQQSPDTPFDVIFLDPPFQQNLVPQTLLALSHPGWLSPKAVIYVEQEKQTPAPPLPPGFFWDKEKIAGQCAYRLARRLALVAASS